MKLPHSVRYSSRVAAFRNWAMASCTIHTIYTKPILQTGEVELIDLFADQWSKLPSERLQRPYELNGGGRLSCPAHTGCQTPDGDKRPPSAMNAKDRSPGNRMSQSRHRHGYDPESRTGRQYIQSVMSSAQVRE